MGNIGNKGALVFSVLVDPVCHVVQGFGKIAHFVLGFHWNAITQISVGIFGSPPELQDKYLNIISHEADRLEKLTRSLLVLNDLDERKRMMNIRKFDINDVIKNTANTFEVICSKKNIDLELLLSGRELFVEADMEQIQQVLYNLLDNAIKFSNDNSSINIETSVKNDKVFVSVKDHGVGIPKDSLSKVWDRFYKTDTSRGKDRKGTGLGLSIVKEIIKAHNQNINVISTESVGTEFIFTLKKAK